MHVDPTMMKNSWASTNGSWKQEDSKGGILSVEGDKVSITSTSQGTPFNVYFETAAAGGGFFEVTITKLQRNDSLAVGLVAPEQCLPGWKTRGMFYNGNLTNGSSALVVSFGPYLKQDDRVGVRYIRGQDNHVTVVFYHNDRCLGKGFDFDPKEVKYALYYPCLHVSGRVGVSFRVPDIVPETIEREQPAYSHPFEGEFKFTEAHDESKQGEDILVRLERPVVWLLSKETDKLFKLSIKAANRLNATITLADEPLNGNARIEQVSPLATTLLMPPPDLQLVETFLSSALPKFDTIALDSQTGNLTFQGDGYRAICEPYTSEVSFCKSYS